jgi:GDP-D-mannose dehydratase
MQYFTDLLIKAAGFSQKEVTQEINPKFYRPIDIQIQIGDCENLKTMTGWNPKIPIQTTISDLLTYWVRKLST